MLEILVKCRQIWSSLTPPPPPPPPLSTEVFLVQDTSPDFQETWSFLQRRMKDANNFSKASKEVIKWE